MEEQLSQLAVTHLLQHTLRSLCNHETSQWVYAVFWRILPRNYPPPKWDSQGGAYDRSRGNRRNWILVWEDGFCNFEASTAEIEPSECPSDYGNHVYRPYQGLQPDLFFKMSHEIYNYGEGLIGKVAADHSHKWIYKEPNEQEINFLSAWNNSADSQPRTWEAQFQSGIKTIALIAVREGVIQLGSTHKKLSYIESIPGVLLPHPSSSSYPYKLDHPGYGGSSTPDQAWQLHQGGNSAHPPDFYHHFMNHPLCITPSMSSLEALLSKLPSVVPSGSSPQLMSAYSEAQAQAQAEAHAQFMSSNNRMAMEFMGGHGNEKVTKEEINVDNDDNYEDDENKYNKDMGESSSSMASYRQHENFSSYHHDLNVTTSMPSSGY
ncbi:hypothetical protein DCAR_0727788 [Daucus carota subsp. sativus]|uniref:Transcription factor MYC/MYB N-terminal domain-containing protein n=1 Tax=Daucus carota subsp. sativus TaxID=79200 RepID=A0AAF0XK86_DAUCS|nr:hypothetical protein DCAR_0727788 [Daucus carota subsp. sativus]